MIESEKARLRAVTRGVGTKFFNQQVSDRYSDNPSVLEALTLYDHDSLIEVLNKKIDFFFTLKNTVPVVEEVVHVRGISKAKGQIPWMVLHFKFKEQYIKDKETGEQKRVGQRQIRISEIDESKCDTDAIKKAFDGYTFTYGTNWVTYNFDNKKEIKLSHCESKKKGVELIKKAIKFTLHADKKDDEIDKGILTVIPPENVYKGDYYGMVGYCFKVSFFIKKGKRAVKIAQVNIANKARE
jgi:hypothetical protein